MNKEVKIKRINVAKARAHYGKMSGKQRAEKRGTTQVKEVINKNTTMRELWRNTEEYHTDKKVSKIKKKKKKWCNKSSI